MTLGEKVVQASIVVEMLNRARMLLRAVKTANAISKCILTGGEWHGSLKGALQRFAYAVAPNRSPS